MNMSLKKLFQMESKNMNDTGKEYGSVEQPLNIH